MVPIIASIVSGLLSNGLPRVADAVLEKGLDYVEGKLGVKLKPEDEMTDADAKAIREAAMKHDEFLVDAEVKDRANAREMQMSAMQSDDAFVRRYTYYFITVWSFFAMAFIPLIVFGTVPQDNVRFADTIIGFLLGTVISSMFAFLLGSSFGSRQKDKEKAK